MPDTKCPSCGAPLRKVERYEPFYVELPPGLALYQCTGCFRLYICREDGSTCHEYSDALYQALWEEYERRKSQAQARSEAGAPQPSGQAPGSSSSNSIGGGAGEAREKGPISVRLETGRFSSMVDAWERIEKELLEKLESLKCPHCGAEMKPVAVTALTLTARRAIVLYRCERCWYTEHRLVTF